MSEIVFPVRVANLTDETISSPVVVVRDCDAWYPSGTSTCLSALSFLTLVNDGDLASGVMALGKTLLVTTDPGGSVPVGSRLFNPRSDEGDAALVFQLPGDVAARGTTVVYVWCVVSTGTPPVFWLPLGRVPAATPGIQVSVGAPTPGCCCSGANPNLGKYQNLINQGPFFVDRAASWGHVTRYPAPPDPSLLSGPNGWSAAKVWLRHKNLPHRGPLPPPIMPACFRWTAMNSPSDYTNLAGFTQFDCLVATDDMGYLPDCRDFMGRLWVRWRFLGGNTRYRVKWIVGGTLKNSEIGIVDRYGALPKGANIDPPPEHWLTGDEYSPWIRLPETNTVYKGAVIHFEFEDRTLSDASFVVEFANRPSAKRIYGGSTIEVADFLPADGGRGPRAAIAIRLPLGRDNWDDILLTELSALTDPLTPPGTFGDCARQRMRFVIDHVSSGASKPANVRFSTSAIFGVAGCCTWYDNPGGKGCLDDGTGAYQSAMPVIQPDLDALEWLGVDAVIPMFTTPVDISAFIAKAEKVLRIDIDGIPLYAWPVSCNSADAIEDFDSCFLDQLLASGSIPARAEAEIVSIYDEVKNKFGLDTGTPPSLVPHMQMNEAVRNTYCAPLLRVFQAWAQGHPGIVPNDLQPARRPLGQLGQPGQYQEWLKYWYTRRFTLWATARVCGLISNAALVKSGRARFFVGSPEWWCGDPTQGAWAGTIRFDPRLSDGNYEEPDDNLSPVRIAGRDEYAQGVVFEDAVKVAHWEPQNLQGKFGLDANLHAYWFGLEYYLRCSTRKRNLPMGLLSYMGEDEPSYGRYFDYNFPNFRMLAGLMAGARYFYLYAYGPKPANGPVFAYETYAMKPSPGPAKPRPAFGQVAEFKDLVMWLDPLLGASSVRSRDVAILACDTNDFFDPNGRYYGQERISLYSALREAGFPADVISEDEVIEDNILSGYSHLYVVDSYVPNKAQDKIREWVGAGGRLWACTGAFEGDESGTDPGILDEVFGIHRDTKVAANIPSPWQWDLRTEGLPQIGILLRTGQVAGLPVYAMWTQVTLDPLQQVQVLAEFGPPAVSGGPDNGDPAATVNRFGAGYAVFVAALVAGSFFRERHGRCDSSNFFTYPINQTPYFAFITDMSLQAFGAGLWIDPECAPVVISTPNYPGFDLRHLAVIASVLDYEMSGEVKSIVALQAGARDLALTPAPASLTLDVTVKAPPGALSGALPQQTVQVTWPKPKEDPFQQVFAVDWQ